MPDAYDQIPPERRSAYLGSAKDALNEAVESVTNPAIEDLGELVVKDAQDITETDTRGARIADEADEFLSAQEHVGDQAEKSLRAHNRHAAAQVDELTGEGRSQSVGRTVKHSGHPDISGTTVSDAIKQMGAEGLGDQLWTTMIEQNNIKPNRTNGSSEPDR